jgi:hypothetical protein
MVISGAETARVVPNEMAIVKAIQIYINQKYFMLSSHCVIMFPLWKFGNVILKYILAYQ